MLSANKPILFATLGFPGSGKTYFSRKFSKEFHLLHLNSDRIRKAMFGKPQYNYSENQTLFRVIDELVQEALSSGISVLYDTNVVKREYRLLLEKIAKKYRAQFLLLWFQAPLSISRQRIGARKTCRTKTCSLYHPPVPLAVLNRLRKAIEEPTPKEPTIFVKGTDTYVKQKKAVLEKVSL